jgi:hypothetical protein
MNLKNSVRRVLALFSDSPCTTCKCSPNWNAKCLDFFWPEAVREWVDKKGCLTLYAKLGHSEVEYHKYVKVPELPDPQNSALF